MVTDFYPAAYFREFDVFYIILSADDKLAVEHDLYSLECIGVEILLRLWQNILLDILLEMVLPLFGYC